MNDRESMLAIEQLWAPLKAIVVPIKAMSRKGLALMAQKIGMPRSNLGRSLIVYLKCGVVRSPVNGSSGGEYKRQVPAYVSKGVYGYMGIWYECESNKSQ
jgi:hypothetical protein